MHFVKCLHVEVFCSWLLFDARLNLLDLTKTSHSNCILGRHKLTLPIQNRHSVPSDNQSNFPAFASELGTHTICGNQNDLRARHQNWLSGSQQCGWARAPVRMCQRSWSYWCCRSFHPLPWSAPMQNQYVCCSHTKRDSWTGLSPSTACVALHRSQSGWDSFPTQTRSGTGQAPQSCSQQATQLFPLR